MRCKHVGSRSICTFNIRDGISYVAEPGKIWIDIGQHKNQKKAAWGSGEGEDVSRPIRKAVQGWGSSFAAETFRCSSRFKVCINDKQISYFFHVRVKNWEMEWQLNPSHCQGRDSLTKELAEADIPHDLSAVILHFLTVRRSSHIFLSPRFVQHCVLWLKKTNGGTPNKVCTDRDYVWDWRGW